MKPEVPAVPTPRTEWGDSTTPRMNAVLQEHFCAPEWKLSMEVFEAGQRLERELSTQAVQMKAVEKERDESKRQIDGLNECLNRAHMHELQMKRERDEAQKLSVAISRDCNSTALERNELRSRLSRMDAVLRELPAQVVLHVAELPDRNSPDDWPEAMIVTDTELRNIVINCLESLTEEQAHLTDSLSKAPIDVAVGGTGLIYLASPYSHPDPAVMIARFDEVCCIAADLMRSGVHLYCPIAHTHPIAQHDLPKGWDYWEQYDRKILAVCDEIWVCKMEGWGESRGVTAELAIAKELGLPVRFIEPRAPGASLRDAAETASSPNSPNPVVQEGV